MSDFVDAAYVSAMSYLSLNSGNSDLRNVINYLADDINDVDAQGNRLENVFHSGSGDVFMIGNGGGDTFIMDPGFGRDIIADFSTMQGGAGTLSFSHSDFADASAVMAAATQVNGDVVIAKDASHSVLLLNASLASLSPAQITFAA